MPSVITNVEAVWRTLRITGDHWHAQPILEEELHRRLWQPAEWYETSVRIRTRLEQLLAAAMPRDLRIAIEEGDLLQEFPSCSREAV